MTRIRRYQPRRSRQLPCGCLLVFAVIFAAAVYMLWATPLLTMLVLGISGAQQLGRTDSLFPADAPATLLELQDQTTPRQMILQAGEYGQEILYPDPRVYIFTEGVSAAGERLILAQFTEAGLLQLCRDRNLCAGDKYRNIQVDLRPGGAVVYADVDVGVWQRVGLVLQIQGDQFQVAGVDVDGILYDSRTLPGEVAPLVREFEQVGQDVLRVLTVSTGVERLSLDAINITEIDVTIIFR